MALPIAASNTANCAVIRVFKDKTQAAHERIEVAPATTLMSYIKSHCDQFQDEHKKLFSANLNGQPLQWEEQWDIPLNAGDVLDLFNEPKEAITATMLVISVISAMYAYRAAQNIPDTYNSTAPAGSSIYDVNVQANKSRLMGVVPLLLGRHKIIPDYLNQPRREWKNHQQELNLMLCVARNKVEVEEDKILIGDTPVNRLSDFVDYRIFQPGENVTGHPAHRSEYQVKEVGGSDGRSGLELLGPDFDLNRWAGHIYVIGSKRLQLRDLYNGTVKFFSDYPGNHVGKIIEIYDFPSVADPLFSAFYKVTAQNDAADEHWIEVERCDISGNVVPGWAGWPEADHYNWVSQKYRVLHQSYGAWLGFFSATPSEQGTTQTRLDFSFPQGLTVLSGGGGTDDHEVKMMIEYRSGPDAPITTEIRTFSDSTLDQRAYTLTYHFPEGSQPEFRVRRLTQSEISIGHKDECDWAGLRSELPTATSYPWTTMAVTIRGDNRLGSAAESKFSVIGTGCIPNLQRDGAGNFSWSQELPTRNPADIAAYAVKQSGHGDDALALGEFWRLREIFKQRNDTFDAVIDNETTLWKTLERVLKVGFSEPTIDFGQVVPVRDEPKTVFKHQFQADNITSDFSFDASMFDEDEQDGYEVEYYDSITWKPKTIVCRLPGVVGDNLKKVRLFGVTDRTKAYQLGMRMVAVDKYRRIQWKFGTEMDGFNCRKLDYCALGVDTPELSQVGRVVAVDGRLLELSEPVQWGDGVHHILVRRPDGSGQSLIATPGPGEYFVNISETLDFKPVLNGSMEPPYFQFGESERMTIPAKLRTMKPKGMHEASLVAAEDRPEVYQFDDAVPAKS